jgi:hypothetical protein
MLAKRKGRQFPRAKEIRTTCRIAESRRHAKACRNEGRIKARRIRTSSVPSRTLRATPVLTMRAQRLLRSNLCEKVDGPPALPQPRRGLDRVGDEPF